MIHEQPHSECWEILQNYVLSVRQLLNVQLILRHRLIGYFEMIATRAAQHVIEYVYSINAVQCMEQPYVINHDLCVETELKRSAGICEQVSRHR
jgi:hypothetical protein